MSAEQRSFKATALKLAAIDPSADGYLSEMENVLKMTGTRVASVAHSLAIDRFMWSEFSDMRTRRASECNMILIFGHSFFSLTAVLQYGSQ